MILQILTRYVTFIPDKFVRLAQCTAASMPWYSWFLTPHPIPLFFYQTGKSKNRER